ncbi:MAG: DnaJ domain-containing protein [Alphaproteobacteria bacterium]
MAWLFLGVCVLAALLLAGRWFASANPTDLARYLRLAGAVVFGLIAAFLLFTGRFGLGVPAAFLALALLRRWRLPNLGPGGFGGLGGGKSAGQTSEVTTDYLRMTLEHDTGLMRGTVLKGAHTGQELSELDRDQLLELLAECHREDASSAQLLESYLERAHGDEWREAAGGTSGGSAPQSGGAMSRDEALDILGLEQGASAEDVRAAYRALMQKLHPDQGGSTYLAAKINQAKDVLLGA